MQILDDALIEKITYHSDCKTTFMKYKAQYIAKLKLYIGGIIFLALVFCADYLYGKEFDGVSPLFLCSIVGIVYLCYRIIKTLLNIKSGKLIINQTIFERIIVVNKDASRYYWARFKGLKDIKVTEYRFKNIQIPPMTEVFVIQSGFSEELLDIIPVTDVQ